MDSSKQLKLGAILSYVSICVNIVTGILFTPWMIQSIGRENFGLYTLATSVISLFIFDFGLGSAVTRYIARYLAEGRQDKADRFLGMVSRLYIIVDVVMFVILTGVFFFIPQIYGELTLAEIEKFKIIYCVAAVYTIISFPFIPLNGVLMAHEKFVQLRICDFAHKIIVVVLMTSCLLIGLGLYSLVIVNAAAGIVMIALKLICIHRYTSQRVTINYFGKTEFRELVGYSGWVTIISLSQRLIFSIAPSILGALSGSAAIAILGIAMTLEGYTFTFANALNGMFLPKVSKIVAQKDGDVLPLMVKVGRLQIYVISLIVFGIICLGRDFIQLWVGDAFSESYICAVLIVLPSLFFLPQDIGTQTIYAKNLVKKLSIVYITMALANVIGAVLLAQSFGALGICISVFLAYMIRVVGLDVILYKDLRINIWSFFSMSYGVLFLPLFISLLVGCGLNLIFSQVSWLLFLVKGLLFVIFYCSFMYFLGMNNDEKILLMSPLKRLIHKLEKMKL